MTSSRNDSTKLTRPDGIRILLLVALGAITLTAGLKLYPSVFPEATIRFRLDRKQSQAVADSLLRRFGMETEGYRHASAFTYDNSAKVFLERELGLRAMNDAVADVARIWKWSHRWFRPLEKEEYRVDISPGGGVVRLERLIPEDAEGARLAPDAAEARARELLLELRSGGEADLKLIGVTTTEREKRTDHQVTWERTDIDWKGGRYRHQVLVQGDRLGAYREFVHVPETWTRDYQRLRAKNATAQSVASIFWILTALAILGVLVHQLRRGAVRWRFALIFGAVGFCLLLLTGLNNFRQDLFEYETTKSFGGFLAEQGLTTILGSLFLGILIAIVTAGGELLYRQSYPRKLSIPGAFSWRGLRSKEVFYSILGGFVLTCFFFAYQTIFYKVASSLGAWSPAEVPYDDLLNSAVPFFFLLFIGFMPAVSEEFMSRAFSIPFFGRFLRSRWLAVVLAAAIWGFAHSGYPNQPFYIRGLEVGLAGVLMGVLMLRFNVLSLLVWHYTVDALYSGYLLLRSGNPYYVASAALAGGVLVLPLLVSVIAYLRTGRFEAVEDLRNEAISPPSPAAQPVAGEEAVETVEAATASGARGLRLATRREAAGAIVATAAVLGVVLLLSARVPEREETIATARSAAADRALAFLDERGFDREGAKSAVVLEGAVPPDLDRYLLSNEGAAGLRDRLPRQLPVDVWKVRIFRPLDPQEATVSIDATSGRVAAFDWRIAEKDTLPSLSAAGAESAAIGLLATVGLSVDGLVLKESEEIPRVARMDRKLAWETAPEDPRGIGEAPYRVEAKVTGDRAAGFRATFRLPEEYVRLRDRHTVAWPIGLALTILGAAGLLVLTIRQALASYRGGRFGWRRMLPVGLVGTGISILTTLNVAPQLFIRYETSIPWGAFLITMLVGLFTGMVLYFLAAWVGSVFLFSLSPVAAEILSRESRRRMLPTAIVAFLCAAGWATILGPIGWLGAAAFPSAATPPDPGGPAELSAIVPWVQTIGRILLRTLTLAWLAAAVLAVLGAEGWPARRARIGLIVAVLIGVALVPARSTAEALWSLARLAIPLLVFAGFVRWLLKANPLAYLLGAYGFFAIPSVLALLGQPGRWAQAHGLVAGAVLVIPLLAAWGSARKGGASGTQEPPAAGRAPRAAPV